MPHIKKKKRDFYEETISSRESLCYCHQCFLFLAMKTLQGRHIFIDCCLPLTIQGYTSKCPAPLHISHMGLHGVKGYPQKGHAMIQSTAQRRHCMIVGQLLLGSSGPMGVYWPIQGMQALILSHRQEQQVAILKLPRGNTEMVMQNKQ